EMAHAIHKVLDIKDKKIIKKLYGRLVENKGPWNNGEHGSYQSLTEGEFFAVLVEHWFGVSHSRTKKANNKKWIKQNYPEIAPLLVNLFGERNYLDRDEISEINGKYKYENDCWYDGGWIRGKKDGWGISCRPDGSKIYEGWWRNGIRNGWGTLFRADGSKKYKGGWIQGKKQGSGTSYRLDESKIYVGSWVQGEEQGWGTLYRADRSKAYEGEMRQGQMDGWGTFYRADRSRAYEGEWRQCKRDGLGAEYGEDGSKKFEGVWKQGKKV
ncbi:hypothetical protein ACFLZV_07250, partial [Candidatus Margulisiibacteriota bacterium]